MKKVIGQQGEVRIIQIDAIPENMETKEVEIVAGGYIISHSEQGHHHLLADGEVMERTDNVPEGMKIFYAIVNEPTEFYQDSATPHGKFALTPGMYMFKVSREYDPFMEQARRVTD